MLFNSYIFVFAFLPITLVGYYGFNKIQRNGNVLAKTWLLMASLFFYGYFNWSYLAIILSSIVINYVLSCLMLNIDNKFIRKTACLVGVVLNVGCLFYYKYYDFFISNINAVIKTSFSLTNVVLPLGISFFTFQQLSYVIDSYQKKVPQYNILDYSLFVTFFPQLIAGPIVLHNEVVPQFADKDNQRFNYDNFGKGIYAFSIGLSKKVLLADTFGVIVNWGFGTIGSLGSINAAIVMLAYTLQIYLDFSGYSDMAIGLGYMFNIELPMNFNSPYKAITIVDFWKSWHMTLTRFFTTYVYFPLGGNRKGKGRTNFNILVVFLVSGLWHGANWTFIVWGLIHGIGQVVCRFGGIKKTNNKIINVGLWLMTFIFVNLTWVVFRADSLTDAWSFFRQLFVYKGLAINETIVGAFQFREFELILKFIPSIGESLLRYLSLSAFIVCLIAIMYFDNTKEKVKAFKEPKWYDCVVTVSLLVWSIVSFTGVSTFLYWNF